MTKPTGRPRGRPPKATSQARDLTRADGWQNVALNLGNKGGDAVRSTRYAPIDNIPKNTLEQMYRGDGLAKRVVDILVDDAMREWIESDEKLIAELARLKAKSEMIDALKWARLFGGSVVVALIDDGLDFEQPVNPNGIRRVLQLRVYDRHRVTWTTTDIDQNPESQTFGQPVYYTVQPQHGGTYRVHVSRVHKIDGLSLPDDARQRNNGWGDSALAPVYQALLNYGMTMNATASIVRDFVQTILSIKGLSEMVRQGEDDMIVKRATLIDMTRSVSNTIFLDADGETYDKKASSVAGLADLWDRFAQHVSATTGIPMPRLTGRSVGGLNTTGDGDEKMWHDVVRAYQTDEAAPLLEWLVNLLSLQLDWSRDDQPETMGWAWPALAQPSEVEWAEVKLKNAQADQVYISAGALDPEYLYHLRYGQGEYRAEITYDQDAYLEWSAEQVHAETDDTTQQEDQTE